MALKLDDLLVKKKEPIQILDLSKSTASNKEDLKKLLEKVPEFKIKIEKVKPQDIKIYNKKLTFATPKKELRRKKFRFANPVPSEMKSLCLDDLCSINIPWKMLTSLRPKNKLDEEYFSKLIELGKLQKSTKEIAKKAPLKSYFKKYKNRAGVLETKIKFCLNCNEDFCSSETCNQFSYECYERLNVSSPTQFSVENNSTSVKKKRKRKKKKKIKRKQNLRKTEGSLGNDQNSLNLQTEKKTQPKVFIGSKSQKRKQFEEKEKKKLSKENGKTKYKRKFIEKNRKI